MGFASWLTCDTKEAIMHTAGGGDLFTVYLATEDGKVWKEENYAGYGIFGNKDIFQLVAELNGKSDREEGIKIVFENNGSGDMNKTVANGYKCPKLFKTESSIKEWNKFDYPIMHDEQGFPPEELKDMEFCLINSGASTENLVDVIERFREDLIKFANDIINSGVSTKLGTKEAGLDEEYFEEIIQCDDLHMFKESESLIFFDSFVKSNNPNAINLLRELNEYIEEYVY